MRRRARFRTTKLLTAVDRTLSRLGEDWMKTFVFGVVLAGLATTSAPARADAVADFYKGKQLTMVIGYSPGGGYDIYGRIMAKYIGRHLPGNPTVVVQNMPGAGSLRAANYLYEVAPKDGTQIGTFGRDIPLIGLLEHNSNV